LPSPLAQWAGARSEYPRDETVVQLFEKAAALHPDAVALVSENKHVSYRELNRRANLVAHELIHRGVVEEELVGLCVDRSPEMIVALLGILKSGAAYVPLDPSYPRERLNLMIADTGTRFVLTQKSAAEAFGSRELIFVDEEPASKPTAYEMNPATASSATSLAYVMYTSGSSGRPKGVMVEHRAIVRLVFGTSYCHFGPDEIFLQFAPISFDASTFEIFGALLHGATLVLMPPQASSLAEIGRVIREHGVTTMWLTAGLFHLFVDERIEDLKPLRQLLAGGDVLSPAHVNKVLQNLPSTKLINGYGPTEGTTFTCCHLFKKTEFDGQTVPIGRPIANTFVYILNEHLEPVGQGEEGELCAGGDGVARGYLNAGDASSGKFLTDPFNTSQSGRLYRTGDLARWMPDGSIEFLGRKDDQIKILGHRIELGEIEATLAQHPALAQTCVVVRTNPAAGKQLAAYVVLRDRSTAPAELKQFLAAKLPPYMVPAFFVFLDRLPLTANGKVDKASLPDAREVGRDGLERPATSELENTIGELWKQVLGVRQVGAEENFFDLGGDSLLIVAVHSNLQKQLQREIEVTDLFEHPTVRSLAKHLESTKPATRAFSAVQEQARKQREALARLRPVKETV